MVSARSPASARACRLSATRARSSRSRSGSRRALARSGRRTSSCSVTPPGARVGERAALQPAQRRGRVDAGQHIGDQRRGDDARDAREREHVAERTGERGVRHPLQVRAQRRRVGAGRPRGVLARGGRAEPQRQRQPAGPARDRRRARVGAQALAHQQRARLVLGERGERQLDRDRLPAVLEPAGLGRIAAGDDDHRVRRAARAAASRAGSRRARSSARRCRSGPAGAPRSTRRPAPARRRPAPAAGRARRPRTVPTPRRGGGSRAAARSCRSRPARG